MSIEFNFRKEDYEEYCYQSSYARLYPKRKSLLVKRAILFLSSVLLITIGAVFASIFFAFIGFSILGVAIFDFVELKKLVKSQVKGLEQKEILTKYIGNKKIALHDSGILLTGNKIEILHDWNLFRGMNKVGNYLEINMEGFSLPIPLKVFKSEKIKTAFINEIIKLNKS